MKLYQFTDFTAADIPLVWNGLVWTFYVFVTSMVLGVALGFVLALISHARVPILRQLITGFVELFRNSPLLVQLFLVFYGIPVVTTFSPTAAEAAILTLTINTAAFTIVNVVAALDAVPRGQWQAASSFGLRYWQIMAYVVLPQAIRTAIPPTMNLAIGQLQTSSLISIIGVTDLTRVGTLLYTRTLRPFVVWPIIGLIYFVISKILSIVAARIERRVRAKVTWYTAA